MTPTWPLTTRSLHWMASFYRSQTKFGSPVTSIIKGLRNLGYFLCLSGMHGAVGWLNLPLSPDPGQAILTSHL